MESNYNLNIWALDLSMISKSAWNKNKKVSFKLTWSKPSKSGCTISTIKKTFSKFLLKEYKKRLGWYNQAGYLHSNCHIRGHAVLDKS